jgi:hypothetical protein
VLDEDSNVDDSGGLSALAIAVIELNTYEDVDEVEDIESYDFLMELDPGEMPDMEDAAGEVLFPSNLSLPPLCLHLTIAERIEEQPDLGMVIIPAELKTEKVDVPCDFDDLSTSHNVLIRHDEPVDAVVRKLSKPSEALNVLEDRISLEAGRWVVGICLIAVRLMKKERVVMRSRSAICILIIMAIVVRMEKELNDKNNNPEQHTWKDLATDAWAITEGMWSNVFEAETCLDDANEDPGDVSIENSLFAWIEDVERDIYRREKDSVSIGENFKVIEEKDLPTTDLIVDESKGSEDSKGLNPNDGPVVDDERDDTGWHWLDG